MSDGESSGPRTLRAAKRTAANLRAALHRSRLRDVFDRVSTTADELATRLAAAYTGGRFGREVSRVGRAVSRVGRAVRSSRVFRSLIGEPEPVTVAVDLRATRTVGPVLALLDRIVGRGASAWTSSRTAAVATELRRECESGPVRVTSLVVLVAVTTTLLVRYALETLSRTGAGAGLVLFGVALAGTRSRRSMAQLRDSRLCRAVGALVTPHGEPRPGPSDSGKAESSDSGEAEPSDSGEVESSGAGNQIDESE